MNKKNLVVTQSNSVISAAYKLSLNEQRAILLILSKIESKDTSYTHETEFTITAKEFAETFDIKNKNNAYGYLVEVGDHLLERKLTLPIRDGRKHYLRTQWISDCEYHEGRGEIKINLAPKMLPLLTQLTSNFTSYHLAHTAKFKSTYSHRIYQMLLQWKKVGKVKIDIDGFRQKLMLTGVYDQYKYLKNKILIPALKEINKHSDLIVEFTEIKEARKVVEIQFYFRLKSATLRIPLNHPKTTQVKNKNQKAPSIRPTQENSSLASSDINSSLKKIMSESFKDILQ